MNTIKVAGRYVSLLLLKLSRDGNNDVSLLNIESKTKTMHHTLPLLPVEAQSKGFIAKHRLFLANCPEFTGADGIHELSHSGTPESA